MRAKESRAVQTRRNPTVQPRKTQLPINGAGRMPRLSIPVTHASCPGPSAAASARSVASCAPWDPAFAQNRRDMAACGSPSARAELAPPKGRDDRVNPRRRTRFPAFGQNGQTCPRMRLSRHDSLQDPLSSAACYPQSAIGLLPLALGYWILAISFLRANASTTRLENDAGMHVAPSAAGPHGAKCKQLATAGGKHRLA